MKPCDQNIMRAIQLSQEMLQLADQGDADREDIGCGILYGVLRDSAYKIWRLAEEEKKRHQAKGWWPSFCHQPAPSMEGQNPATTQPKSKEKEEKP